MMLCISFEVIGPIKKSTFITLYDEQHLHLMLYIGRISKQQPLHWNWISFKNVDPGQPHYRTNTDCGKDCSTQPKLTKASIYHVFGVLIQNTSKHVEIVILVGEVADLNPTH